MTSRLLRPRWLVAHLVVLVLAVVFVRLGFWQLDRHQERQLDNAVGERRFAIDAQPLPDLIEEAGANLGSLVHRRASATGVFDPEHEVLIRSQVHLGMAGFRVVTPLVGEDGQAVMVNRGWVPLVLDQVPVTEAPPPQGVVTVEGWLAVSQERAPLGPEDPEGGRLTALNRVDLERIARQVPYPLVRVYLVEMADRPDQLPAPLPLPTFDDMGPHLGYSIQWFGFSVVGVVGYVFLVRRQLRSPHDQDLDSPSTTS